MHSESIKNLAVALNKVQQELTPVAMTKTNPFFHSRYAGLTECWQACQEVLTKNGFCISQTADIENGDNVIVTTLIHTSGEWISGKLKINPVKNDPQSNGSAITYARRYSLASIIMLTPESDDDDAESAQGRDIKQKTTTTTPTPTKTQKPPIKTQPQVKEGVTPMTDKQSKELAKILSSRRLNPKCFATLEGQQFSQLAFNDIGNMFKNENELYEKGKLSCTIECASSIIDYWENPINGVGKKLEAYEKSELYKELGKKKQQKE